jgi:lysyl-tRNA synthetase class 2
LLARNRIKATFRAHFEAAGFTEVECAQLQVSPGNETHLHAFATEAIGRDGPTRYYLHTSPEFACKKLLAAGERRIFDFARVFRNREHAPVNVAEFTMLEWYRAEETYDAVIADCVTLIRLAAAGGTLAYRGHSVRADAEPERITVAEAFRRHADVDLLATLTPERGDRDALAKQAERAGVTVAADDTWSDVFSRLLSERVEPQLGFARIAILDEYPRVEAALARASSRDPRVAERFEVYACGVELANGFGELIDPVEQRQRFQHEMDEKARIYGERYPIDEDFLAALGAMPAASGVALGFDRLVMLATGAP